MDRKYSNRIKTSRARYRQVKIHLGKEIQAIICFSGELQEKNCTGLNGRYLDFAIHGIDCPMFNGKLLFNQTKIFFNREEIAFSNKSSLLKESIDDFDFVHHSFPFY
jgi:hypothetical protein